MKLRIQGNSLRLRLSQKEVALVRNRGLVESLIEFAPGRSLRYVLEGSPIAETMSATFDGRAIRVKSDRVGVEARSQTGIQLLVEKDFQCLHRSVEQEPDAYPHPAMS
jgi:hypothetical protein